MLAKGNLVGIVGVGLVAVDGLCTVRVLCRRDDLGIMAVGLVGLLLARVCAKGVAVGAARPVGLAATDRGRVFKAVELSRRVHLRRLDRVGGFGAARGTIDAHGRAVHGRVFGQSKRVDESTGRRRGRRAKVEDPQNLVRKESEAESVAGLDMTSHVHRSWRAG